MWFWEEKGANTQVGLRKLHGDSSVSGGGTLGTEQGSGGSSLNPEMRMAEHRHHDLTTPPHTLRPTGDHGAPWRALVSRWGTTPIGLHLANEGRDQPRGRWDTCPVSSLANMTTVITAFMKESQ